MGNLVFANDDVFWISCKYRAEKHVHSLRHTNEVIGAYVTAGVRVYLYRYIDSMRENAIYCVSHPVIYIQPREEHELIETADKLGDTTFELRPSENISEFVRARQRTT